MTDKRSHTAGPWRTFPLAATIGNGCLVDSEFGGICRVHGKDEESQANARLIAASPELLEAVHKAHVLLVAIGDYAHGDVKRELQAAIAKAEGTATTS